MELSAIICMIVCVALNWGSAAAIAIKIQRSEKNKKERD